jgi:hypothetical protein
LRAAGTVPSIKDGRETTTERPGHRYFFKGESMSIIEKVRSAKNTKNSSYELIGQEIGRLVDEKNRAYGDSFHKSGEILKILFPNGIKIEQYDDMLYLIRIIDKQFRIATSKKAFGENPAKDIAGYSILKAEE